MTLLQERQISISGKLQMQLTWICIWTMWLFFDANIDLSNLASRFGVGQLSWYGCWIKLKAKKWIICWGLYHGCPGVSSAHLGSCCRVVPNAFIKVKLEAVPPVLTSKRPVISGLNPTFHSWQLRGCYEPDNPTRQFLHLPFYFSIFS